MTVRLDCLIYHMTNHMISHSRYHLFHPEHYYLPNPAISYANVTWKFVCIPKFPQWFIPNSANTITNISHLCSDYMTFAIMTDIGNVKANIFAQTFIHCILLFGTHYHSRKGLNKSFANRVTFICYGSIFELSANLGLWGISL